MASRTTETRGESRDPRLAPAYSVGEAAHYLRMPEETLRSWVAGRLYPVAGESRRSRPLIHLDDPKKQHLSFLNLVEAHVLAAVRRRSMGESFQRSATRSTTCGASFESSTRSSMRPSRQTVSICSSSATGD